MLISTKSICIIADLAKLAEMKALTMINSDLLRIENLNAADDVLDIRWRVTTLCNYQCAFCIQGDRQAHVQEAQGESASIRRTICDNLCKLIDSDHEHRKIVLALIGGEVTILKDFPALFEQLAATAFPGDITFQITTNLSLPASRFIELCDIVNQHDKPKARRSLHLAASYYEAYTEHSTFVGKLETIAKHIQTYASPVNRIPILGDKLQTIAGHPRTRIALTACFPILTDADFDLLLETKPTFSHYGIKSNPIIIRDYDTAVSAATMDRITDNTSKPCIRTTDSQGNTRLFPTIQAVGMALEDVDAFCPRGYLCDAGMHNLWINAFGDVYRCPTLGGAMHLGSILDGGYRRLEKPESCASDHCSCSQFGVICKPGT